MKPGTIDRRTAILSELPALFHPRNNSLAVAKASPPAAQEPEVIEPEVVAEVPMRRRARLSGFGEPQNLSVAMDAERVQAALRAAERGQVWQLFVLYRDMLVGYSHLQAEWAKRKMVIIGQPHTLIPARKGNAEDERNAKVIGQMIENCEDWMDGLDHLLDATLYPVAVGEKIYRPVEASDELDVPVRFLLKRLAPVPYPLLCYQVPYLPSGVAQWSPGLAPYSRGLGGYAAGRDAANPALIYDPDDWECDLRFYNQAPSMGNVDWSMQNVYAPDRMRHIIHRGNMLSKSIRDNFGGQMRCIMFWWLLATKGRDWWAVYMQKYGSPFILGKADAQQKDTVNFLLNAFSMATQIGGLVIDKRADAQLIQAAANDGATAHKATLQFCNDEVSMIVVGQVLSATAKNTGLGSGVANLHSEVRQDIRLYDMRKLSDTLKKQLFTPYLKMNGFTGRAPDILWGGEKEQEARDLAQTVNQFSQAGLEPTDRGVQLISQRVGYELQRRKIETAANAAAPANGKSAATEPDEDDDQGGTNGRNLAG